MELTLLGKSALITGASSGLGRHFAGVLARTGAEVTLAARRLEAVESEASTLRDAGHHARAAHLDVTAPQTISAVFAEHDPFDIVINNAGISGAGDALNMP